MSGNFKALDALNYFVSGFLNGGIGQGAYFYPLMLQLVFVFPFIYFIIKKSKNGLVICFILNFLYEILKTAYGMNEECYRLLIFRYLFAISIGAYIVIYGINKKGNKWLALSSFIGVVYIFVVEYTGYKTVILTYWKGTSLFSILYIAPIIIWLLMTFSERDMRLVGPVCQLGKASYNIFLVQMLWYLADSLIVMYMPNNIIYLVVCIIICCVVGLIFYKIEQPITQSIILKLCSSEKLWQSKS